ncbi:MAG: hypothetical protein NC311_07610 [Muribaculaceae bacterium]|nr:hypothetical protein [Muribaculaceae bacterium]
MKTLADLQVLMGRMGEAYFYKNGLPAEFTAATDLLATADFAMPVSSDGVNFEFGAPEITREKITEGRVWYTFGEKGDDNISMQVPSLHTDLSDLFYTKVGEAKQAKIGDKTYSAQGYSTKVKKVQGAWIFRDKEHTVAIALPKTDNYANLVGATGDAKGYYNVAISTLEDASGQDLIILQEKAEAGE